MKKKTLSTILSGLLAVSLTGVGFASWYIVQGDTATADGTVKVETISDHSVKLKPVWANNDNDKVWEGAPEDQVGPDKKYTSAAKDEDDSMLKFGSTKVHNTTDDDIEGGNTDVQTGWLRNQDGYGEKKSLDLDVEVGNSEYCASISVEFKVSNAQYYEKLVEANYIKGIYVNDTMIPVTEGETYGTGSVTITPTVAASIDLNVSYDWGTTFGGKNPFEYYNGEGMSPSTKIGEVTAAEHANTHLTQLYTWLDGMTFTLTISATAK